MSAQIERPENEPAAERTTVTLPAALARRLRANAQAQNRSVSSIVREALEAFLQGKEPTELPSFTGAGSSKRRDLSERVEELIADAMRREGS